jgi:hypothetical protein
MLARLLSSGALGMALVALPASANAQSDGNGTADQTQDDRIGDGFDVKRHPCGDSLSLVYPQGNPGGAVNDPGHYTAESDDHGKVEDIRSAGGGGRAHYSQDDRVADRFNPDRYPCGYSPLLTFPQGNTDDPVNDPGHHSYRSPH